MHGHQGAITQEPLKKGAPHLPSKACCCCGRDCGLTKHQLGVRVAVRAVRHSSHLITQSTLPRSTLAPDQKAQIKKFSVLFSSCGLGNSLPFILLFFLQDVNFYETDLGDNPAAVPVESAEVPSGCTNAHDQGGIVFSNTDLNAVRLKLTQQLSRIMTIESHR